jgi:hypothetical protein
MANRDNVSNMRSQWFAAPGVSALAFGLKSAERGAPVLFR